MQKANLKLKELDELKTEFISIASHQLRTPLSIIKGYTSLIEDGAYGEVNKKERVILHNIDTSNERLIKLVDEFLNVSRIEQGRTQFRFAEMNIVSLTEEVITELKEKSNPKNIRLILQVVLEVEKIIADEEKIRHCVFNFVDNAIKYSPVGSRIKVVLEPKNGGLNLQVFDAGVGLDKKDLTQLFQKFYRSPNVMRDFQGTGLGLYVVKEFITAHHGKVWAKSKGVGKGSEFGFWIPFANSAKV